MKKNEKGITLVSLIIMVIILLILSTVTFMTVTSDNGILSFVRKQKSDMIEVEAKQAVDIAIEKVKLKYVSNKEVSIEEFTSELELELQKNDTTSQVNISSNEENNITYDVTYNGYNFTYYFSSAVDSNENEEP